MSFGHVFENVDKAFSPVGRCFLSTCPHFFTWGTYRNQSSYVRYMKKRRHVDNYSCWEHIKMLTKMFFEED